MIDSAELLIAALSDACRIAMTMRKLGAPHAMTRR
jgi:hypothetical protein